jgi:hypothetical protein
VSLRSVHLAMESVGKFVSLVFSASVSEPRAVATGSCDTLANVSCSAQLRLDPVATARGSDTSRRLISPNFQIGNDGNVV